MKYVWRIAFLGVIFSPMALAEMTVVKKDTAQLAAFENMDAKLAALENYSVSYVDGSKTVVIKAAQHQQKSNDSMTVKLIAANNR